MFIDESHVTLPQCRAMYAGDRSRKDALVNYGFRLPSAYDNRPLNFPEFDQKINPCLRFRHTRRLRAHPFRPDGGAGHPSHRTAGSGGGGASH